MADVTPIAPEGRQLIEAYGDGRFRISARAYEGSVIVFADAVLSWSVTEIGALTPDSLSPAAERASELDVLIVGTGDRFVRPDPALVETCRRHGMALEMMDTGAACRTYNLLLGDGRRVAAALIAVD